MKNHLPNHDCHERNRLCELRDQEFMELFKPTFDAMLSHGVSHPRLAAAIFTIANGQPHYHVSHEHAYRCVRHMLNASEIAGDGATAQTDMDMPEDGEAEESHLRGKMWNEFTQRVRGLIGQGMGLSDAVDHVLEHCRASRFFITPSTALTKICSPCAMRARALR